MGVLPSSVRPLEAASQGLPAPGAILPQAEACSESCPVSCPVGKLQAPHPPTHLWTWMLTPVGHL